MFSCHMEMTGLSSVVQFIVESGSLVITRHQLAARMCGAAKRYCQSLPGGLSSTLPTRIRSRLADRILRGHVSVGSCRIVPMTMLLLTLWTGIPPTAMIGSFAVFAVFAGVLSAAPSVV